MKRFLGPIIPFALVTALALTGCANTDAPVEETALAAEQAEQQTAETPTAPDLSGDWVYTSPDNKDDALKASITDGVITVEWDLQSTGITGIYWVGTFEAPTTNDEPYTWTSQRDTVATDSELLAATSDTKDFTYKDDTLSFDVSIQGDTANVQMKRA